MAKKLNVLGLVLLLAGVVCAQESNPGQHAVSEIIGAKAMVKGPSYADVYCGGYITSQPPPTLGSVAGAWNTPHSALYGMHDYVYLKGSGFTSGQTYEILRQVRDPNHMRTYAGEMPAIAAAGKVYFEIGQVKVLDVRGPVAITQVTFSCEGILLGDVAVAMPQRNIPLYHGPMEFDRFAPPNGKTTGRILLARDFDSMLGTRAKVYLSIGADKGVKPGDYFRVTRDYVAPRKDEVDRVSFGSRDMVDDTQANPQRLPMEQLNLLPRRSLGELVVTEVTPRSSTAVITFALEEMFLGDIVEMIDVPPPVVEAVAQPNGPAIACTAAPAALRCGDNSTINCDASSPDNRPLTIAFASDHGSLSPRDNNATLSTPRDFGSGTITVNATVTDDRNLSASTAVMVNVECAPPQATMSEVAFKTNSAYVDNRAKAMLDGIALRLNQDRDAKAVIVGYSDARESKTLAQRRADAVKTYLTKTKGIDAGRITTRTGTGAGKKAEVWVIPAGAAMP